MKIAFAPIGTCENNRRIWRHNANISRSRDVTDLLCWRHNAKSETTVPGGNCEMNDRWLFLAELCVQDIKKRVRNKIIHSLPWITIFGSLVMRFANDFHSWLHHSWTSLANRLTRDTKIVIHGNSCIILYFIHCWHHGHSLPYQAIIRKLTNKSVIFATLNVYANTHCVQLAKTQLMDDND